MGDTGLVIHRKRAREKPDAPNFDNAAPATKARLLADGDNDPSAVQAFFPTGAPANLPRQAKFPTRLLRRGFNDG